MRACATGATPAKKEQRVTLLATAGDRCSSTTMHRSTQATPAAPPRDGAFIGGGGADAARQLLSRGLASEYDPTGGQLQGASSPGGARASGSGAGSEQQPVKVKITDVAAFLMAPGPREGPVHCIITREKDSGIGMKNHK
jgi:hypothetical protein